MLLAAQSLALWAALRQRSIWAPALFTFFWSVGFPDPMCRPFPTALHIEGAACSSSVL